MSCLTQIVWERDTVWRQMIGKERRGEGDGQVKNLTPGHSAGDDTTPLLDIPTPVGKVKVTGKRVSLIVAAATFVTLLNVQVVDGLEANRCFAILVFATILWATEVSMPDLFRTSKVCSFCSLRLFLYSSRLRQYHCSWSCFA